MHFVFQAQKFNGINQILLMLLKSENITFLLHKLPMKTLFKTLTILQPENVMALQMKWVRLIFRSHM